MPHKTTYKVLPGYTILLIILSFLPFSAFGALTSVQVFDKAKEKITSAKSLQADFSMSAQGQTIKGKIYAKGSKFSIISSSTSSWYNGKLLYTYDKGANETYLYSPSEKELREVNPLIYLSSSSDYKITGKKEKTKGMESVILIPQKARSGIKSIMIDIDTKNYTPTKIIINTSGGGTMILNISNVKLDVNLENATFEYPKSKYPNVSISDMR